jgi:hypothetical protein
VSALALTTIHVPVKLFPDDLLQANIPAHTSNENAKGIN